MKSPAAIPHSQILSTPDDWQAQLRDVITSGRALLSELKLENSPDFSALACRDFPLKVPRDFVRRMKIGDPRDPLLLQVLASNQELLVTPGYSDDPVGETGEANVQPGIIQKYHGRVLLILSGGCAINCRYCFRRHFPYSENQNSRKEWSAAIRSIADDPQITEVILSGGDPLLVSDRHLAELVEQIAAIPHVQRLRIHTRLPIVIPQRITDTLLDAISHPRLKTVMVIHCNHAREIDSGVADAMQRMKQRDITLLNQSVLLAGINDNIDALAELSESLFEVDVLPYYLHLLDKVQGAAHFDVPSLRARELMAGIRARLPGFLVPRLVQEQPGATSKVTIA